MKKNEGKKFEEDFVKSIDESHVLVKRLNDNASAWSGGSNTRFASNNECDFILYDENTQTLYGLELKSTKEDSLTFWREDFEDKTKKQTFMIRKCQILGLEKFSKYKGVFGFVINFRSHNNQTFFVSITDFLNYTKSLQKKRINYGDVLKMNPLEIDGHLVRTRHRYNVEKFLADATGDE